MDTGKNESLSKILKDVIHKKELFQINQLEMFGKTNFY